MADQEHPRLPAQYGEFATPDEQQRARGVDAGADDTVHAAQDAPAPARQHPVDSVVTLVLLAFGLFVVLNGIPGYLALPDVLQGVYDSLDGGTYPATETAASLGVTALVLQSVIWVGTALLSTMAIRRGRMGWWIAVVGGAISFIVIMVIVSVALFADPGFPGNVPL